MPEVQKFIGAFDTQMGAGAFRETVDNLGKAHYQEQGADMTPLDAITKTMERYKPLLGDLGQQAKAVAEPEKPRGSIPNLGTGSGSISPTKPIYTSVEDLKKFATKRLQELQGQD